MIGTCDIITRIGVIVSRRIVLIGILGAGGQADEVKSILKNEPLFCAVEEPYVSEASVNIDNMSDEDRMAPVVIAVGAPALKAYFSEKWQGKNFAKVIAESALIGESSEISEGSIVGEGVIITSDVKIGKHVLLNIGCTISHNTQIEDYSTISPGAHIGGNVKISKGVFVGIGASIINNISIAEGVVIGAGAVVTRDIEEVNAVYAGVPAVKIKVNDGWLREI